MNEYIYDLDEVGSIDFINKINSKKITDEECNIIIKDSINCMPYGMLLVSSAIKKFRDSNSDVKFRIQMKCDNNSIQYAGHMGFFKNISLNIPYGNLPGEAMGSDSYVPITTINFRNYRSNLIYSHMMPVQYIELQAERLAKVLCQENIELKKLFTYLIREILRNCEEHGQVNSASICAQSWKSKNLAEIAILDNGIGYKNSLIKKYKKIDSDEMAIKLALRPGITEAYFNKYTQEEDNSGFGLYVASEICDNLGGSFSVISGNSLVKKSKGTIITKEAYHNGVAIKMLIPINFDFKYQKMIDDIVMNGEKELKNEKIKASKLSKGKLFIKY